ncbi:TonB-dependent siderophore receptor [Ferrovibrio sp.]|uniref:TonB-dependent receptor plug domain-containing protein n=1 Tax=Ferrovibrio sp. TaxID=1917215 RepID=UPI0025B8C286|nr:TonB-dependent receptor [Ferrovibrio sp.]
MSIGGQAVAQTATAPTQLSAISVTANMTETPVQEVGSAVTIITGEELQQRQTQLVSDVLREVPGMAVSRTGGVGGPTQVRIRGSEGNQTLVLIDGVEVNSVAGSSEFDFAHLLAADIERIEVLRGPQSALYGSDAAGGVINIVTRRGSGKPIFSGAFEGGSFNTYQTNASVRGGNERYHFLLSGVDYRTGGITRATESRGNFENDAYRNKTIFSKFGVAPAENLNFDFVGRYTYYQGEYDGSDTFAFDDTSRTNGSQIYGRGQGKLVVADGHWEHIVGTAYTQNDTNSYNTTSSSYGDKVKYDYRTNVLFDTPSFADARHTVTLQAEQENESFVSSFVTPYVEREISSTGFVGVYKVDFFRQLFLTGAVREDRNDIFRDARTYRGTAAYRFLNTDTKLRGGYGTGVKNPTMSELYGFTSTFTGNPNLQPEETKGWDIGVDQGFWGNRGQVGLTYFDQRVDKLIQNSGATAANVNGESKIRGIELEGTIEPVTNLTLRAAYTYMKTEMPITGEELVRRPAHVGSFNANYRFMENRANVNLGILYNGRQVDNNFETGFGANTSRQTLNGYALVNLAAGYMVTENVEVFGRLENLLDKQYEDVYTYQTPGRAIYAGVRATF